MNLYQQALEQVKDRKPYVAKHPKTGKWYAIESTLSLPVGNPCDTREQAEQEWREWTAMQIVERHSRLRLVKGVC